MDPNEQLDILLRNKGNDDVALLLRMVEDLQAELKERPTTQQLNNLEDRVNRLENAITKAKGELDV